MNERQFHELREARKPDVLEAKRSNVRFQADATKLVFPGSFNPIHQGHLVIARIAKEKFDLPIWFEISIQNVEKSTINFTALAKRLEQNFQGAGVLVSNAPTFEQKLSLLPNTNFVVGADTILRIDDPKYYRDEQHFHGTINRFHHEQVRFLVFGRRQDGEFIQSDGSLSSRLKELCVFVPQTEFDMPISSSEIRNASRHFDER